MGAGLSLIICADPATANTCFWASLQNHTITERVRLGGTSEDHLVHHYLPGLEQGQLLRLSRTMIRWVLSISKDTDSTVSLGSLWQCSLILTIKVFLPICKCNFLYFNLCPLPLGLSLGITKKNLASTSLICLIRHLSTWIRSP